MSKCDKVFQVLSYCKATTAPSAGHGFLVTALPEKLFPNFPPARHPTSESQRCAATMGRSSGHIWPSFGLMRAKLSWVHLWSLLSDVMKTQLSFSYTIGEVEIRIGTTANLAKQKKPLTLYPGGNESSKDTILIRFL